MLDYIGSPAMTSDLELALRLKQRSKHTLQSTIQSLRNLRKAVARGGDLSVDTERGIVAEPDPALRNMLQPKASQLLSDARRALKVWDDLPI
jgi:hypothetical protein